MIRAIPTVYKGIPFRSRLEARWAVFYDSLGLSWEYEKEGFEGFAGAKGRYLPDFWFPLTHSKHRNAGYWVEIKGIHPTQQEMSLARQLTQHTGRNTLIYYGTPWPGEFAYYSFTRAGTVHHFTTEDTDLFHTQNGSECPLSHPGTIMRECNMLFTQAYKNARAARFEHGESPCTSTDRHDFAFALEEQ